MSQMIVVRSADNHRRLFSRYVSSTCLLYVTWKHTEFVSVVGVCALSHQRVVFSVGKLASRS